MVKLIFVEHNGNRHEVDADVGRSVMEVAADNGIPGILADCGGFCSCATCHVYIEAPWQEQIAEMAEDEGGMVECAIAAKASSRLSCQVKVLESHNGLEVHIPVTQV
jgi:2Fe-2S ferredoxin